MDLFLPVKHLPLQTNCTDPLSDQLPEITKKISWKYFFRHTFLFEYNAITTFTINTINWNTKNTVGIVPKYRKILESSKNFFLENVWNIVKIKMAKYYNDWKYLEAHFAIHVQFRFNQFCIFWVKGFHPHTNVSQCTVVTSQLGFLIDTKTFLFVESHQRNFPYKFSFKLFCGVREESFVKLCSMLVCINKRTIPHDGHVVT